MRFSQKLLVFILIIHCYGNKTSKTVITYVLRILILQYYYKTIDVRLLVQNYRSRHRLYISGRIAHYQQSLSRIRKMDSPLQSNSVNSRGQQQTAESASRIPVQCQVPRVPVVLPDSPVQMTYVGKRLDRPVKLYPGSKLPVPIRPREPTDPVRQSDNCIEMS